MDVDPLNFLPPWPGLMPCRSLNQLQLFKEKMGSTELPSKGYFGVMFSNTDSITVWYFKAWHFLVYPYGYNIQNTKKFLNQTLFDNTVNFYLNACVLTGQIEIAITWKLFMLSEIHVLLFLTDALLNKLKNKKYYNIVIWNLRVNIYFLYTSMKA